MPDEPLNKYQEKCAPGGPKRYYHLIRSAWKEAVEGDSDAALAFLKMAIDEGYDVHWSIRNKLNGVIREVAAGVDPRELSCPKPPFDLRVKTQNSAQRSNASGTGSTP